MTIQTLSSVTLATIENYRHAASLAARAYRTGSHRLIKAVNSSLEERVDPRTSEFVPRLTKAMQQARGRVSEFTVKGVDEVSGLAEKAVDIGSDGAARQVHRIADFAAGVETPILANGLQAAARLSMPTAKVALAVSKKVNEGAKTLSSVARGKSLKTVAEEAKAGATRRVQRTQRKATQTRREVVKTVRAAAAAPRKTAARVSRKTEAAVVETAAAVETAAKRAVKAPRKTPVRAKRAAAPTAA